MQTNHSKRLAVIAAAVLMICLQLSLFAEGPVDRSADYRVDSLPALTRSASVGLISKAVISTSAPEGPSSDVVVTFTEALIDSSSRSKQRGANCSALLGQSSFGVRRGSNEASENERVILDATGRNSLPDHRRVREFDEILEGGGLSSSNRTGGGR